MLHHSYFSLRTPLPHNQLTLLLHRRAMGPGENTTSPIGPLLSKSVLTRLCPPWPANVRPPRSKPPNARRHSACAGQSNNSRLLMSCFRQSQRCSRTSPIEARQTCHGISDLRWTGFLIRVRITGNKRVRGTNGSGNKRVRSNPVRHSHCLPLAKALLGVRDCGWLARLRRFRFDGGGGLRRSRSIDRRRARHRISLGSLRS